MLLHNFMLILKIRNEIISLNSSLDDFETSIGYTNFFQNSIETVYFEMLSNIICI